MRLFFGRRAAKVGTSLIIILLLTLLLGSLLWPYSPYQKSVDLVAPPSPAHPFGTDFQGQDILSEFVWGAYPSLFVAVLAAIGSSMLGLGIGLVAGYFPRWEAVLSGASDVFLTFPPLPLLILVGILFSDFNFITIAIIVVLWPPVARAVRSKVLSVKARAYVEAAKTSGSGDFAIIKNIMIPAVASITFAYFVLSVAIAVVFVTGLEFYGVGNPNVVSWGGMFYWAQQFAFYSGAWWWIIAPGAGVTIFVTGLALIGFSVEEISNPRLR
jgi:peptide/nickel transport system permease protein